jgi:hypothetical protein
VAPALVIRVVWRAPRLYRWINRSLRGRLIARVMYLQVRICQHTTPAR